MSWVNNIVTKPVDYKSEPSIVSENASKDLGKNNKRSQMDELNHITLQNGSFS